jgi:hypothetical protein
MLRNLYHRPLAMAIAVQIMITSLGLQAEPSPLMTAETFWQRIEPRLGPPIYEKTFDEPQVISDWTIEGPAQLRVDNGKLHYASIASQAVEPEHGHSVLWFPVELPETYLIEWTFKPTSEHGLGILFFDAVPVDLELESILDPAMPPRDGSFAGYVKGAIRSYHVSYFANTPFNPERGNTHLRGNPGLRMLATGPDAVPVVPFDQRQPVRLRLIREADRVTFLADDRLILSHPLPRFEPSEHKHQSARAGFRQMQWTRAEYGSLSIRPLWPVSKSGQLRLVK